MVRKKRTKDRKFVDKNVYELAKERIDHLFDMFDNLVVMFSGGKDSTATLNVALEVAERRGRLPLKVVFIDEEAIPMETEIYVRRVYNDPRVDMDWYCIPVKHRNACSRKQPYWHPWNPDEKELWVRDLPPEGITKLEGFRPEYSTNEANAVMFPPSKYKGTTVMLMGIRAQESLNRLRIVTKRITDNYISEYAEAMVTCRICGEKMFKEHAEVCKDGKYQHGQECYKLAYNKALFKAYPIYDWTHQDVWTAPKIFGWDYNTTYDVLDKAGISPAMQRCSPPFGEEPLQKLWSYKTCFPDIWDKMSKRVLGVNTAIRYALTELYAYGGRPVKPADQTWEEYITTIIKRHDPDVIPQIAKRIQDEIKFHYRQTKDPILAKAPHPETGMNWDFLVMVAMRGDFKGRKQVGAAIKADKPKEEYWAEYEEAREIELGGNPNEKEARSKKPTFSKY